MIVTGKRHENDSGDPKRLVRLYMQSQTYIDEKFLANIYRLVCSGGSVLIDNNSENSPIEYKFCEGTVEGQ